MEHMPEPEEIFGTFQKWSYDEQTWIIAGCDRSLYLYLLEGTEKSLLIDTAYGFGNLDTYVAELIHTPLVVANTHGHLDHAGGNGYFTEVFMHEKAEIDHATFVGGPCDISKLPHPDYKKRYLHEGDIIDLGGRQIEVIDISAHSNGSLAFLDKSRRLLYCGDEIESEQVLMYDMINDSSYDFKAAIERHKANMEKLWSRRAEFDFLCPAHNGAPISKDYILDYIELSERILNHTVKIEDRLNHKYIEMDPVAPQLCRVRYNRASFFVRKKLLELV